RDVLARSSVGVLFENRSRSVTGQGSNQAWGLDGSFGLTDDLSVVGYYAQTQTNGRTGPDHVSYRGQISYQADEYGANVGHLVVGNDFAPEMGFVRRRDFRQTTGQLRFSPRTESISWIRQVSFQGGGSYLENERTGLVETRDYGGGVGVEFENSDNFNVSFTNSYENLVQQAGISGAQIPAGRYEFPEFGIGYRLGPQRPFIGNLSFRWGDYFGGTIRSAGIGGGRIEVTPQISLEPSISFNWIDLPNAVEPGRYDQHVAVTRLTYTLTPRAYVSGLVQYNSRSHVVSGNFRFRWEWAPGSELFLVYTEDRSTDVTDRWSELSNRGFVIKVTRLLRM
ncbi:MAG TPA: hypothetical protein VMM35_04240, partial [Longimicrobiales bacterium]|nr:hypothetical protein [Longimicrobiales bacterium]